VVADQRLSTTSEEQAIQEVAVIGLAVGLLLLSAANLLIHRGESPGDMLMALPFFHAAMLVYVASMIADFFI
jgi:hypothetical protein